MITPWLPLSTRIRMLLRLLTIQGSYNYETMIGTGMAFAMEPALRLLPGGPAGDAYRDAMVRQSRYFNAHPYFASVAVGALVRAELSLEPPERIERFRTAACGPLGSVGDRLVWAAWLPLCSLLGLTAFALGLPAWGVVSLFLGVYNAGHLAIRVWGLDAGWRHGLSCAAALNTPVLRAGPAVVTRAAAFAGSGTVRVAPVAPIGRRWGGKRGRCARSRRPPSGSPQGGPRRPCLPHGALQSLPRPLSMHPVRGAVHRLTRPTPRYPCVQVTGTPGPASPAPVTMASYASGAHRPERAHRVSASVPLALRWLRPRRPYSANMRDGWPRRSRPSISGPCIC